MKKIFLLFLLFGDLALSSNLDDKMDIIPHSQSHFIKPGENKTITFKIKNFSKTEVDGYTLSLVDPDVIENRLSVKNKKNKELIEPSYFKFLKLKESSVGKIGPFKDKKIDLVISIPEKTEIKSFVFLLKLEKMESKEKKKGIVFNKIIYSPVYVNIKIDNENKMSISDLKKDNDTDRFSFFLENNTENILKIKNKIMFFHNDRKIYSSYFMNEKNGDSFIIHPKNKEKVYFLYNKKLKNKKGIKTKIYLSGEEIEYNQIIDIDLMENNDK